MLAVVACVGGWASTQLPQHARSRPVRVVVSAVAFGDTSVGAKLAQAVGKELRIRHQASELTVVSVKEYLHADLTEEPSGRWSSDDLLTAMRIVHVEMMVEVNARGGRMGEIMAQPIMISSNGNIDTMQVLAAPDLESAAIGIALRIGRSPELARLLGK